MVRRTGLKELLEANTREEWANTLFALSSACGFNQALCGILPNKQMPLENAFFCSNCSAQWQKIYAPEKSHHFEPIVTHCLRSSTPIVWSPVAVRKKSHRNTFDDTVEHNIYAGITFPIHGPNGEFGVISFVTEIDSEQEFKLHIDRSLADLSLLRDYVFESSLKFLQPELQKDRPCLTKREVECLRWVMEGKSSWEISSILNCSEATVNFHITNVREKFHVRTRQQAVVKAIHQGILMPG